MTSTDKHTKSEWICIGQRILFDKSGKCYKVMSFLDHNGEERAYKISKSGYVLGGVYLITHEKDNHSSAYVTYGKGGENAPKFIRLHEYQEDRIKWRTAEVADMIQYDGEKDAAKETNAEFDAAITTLKNGMKNMTWKQRRNFLSYLLERLM